jgi:predicted kinase
MTVIIVVAGIPGSGKTTLAQQLAPALELPLISKDGIKETLMDALGSGDMTWATRLSRAAHLVMYKLAGEMQQGVVLEAHFYCGIAEEELVALERPLVQVYCRCPVDLAWERYQRRRDDPRRHAGHRSEHQDEDATQHWRESAPRPLALDAPLIEVDTAGLVDIDELAGAVRAAIASLARARLD